MSTSRTHLLAPLTAAALIAQQVGSNAIRDGLLLSAFPVTSVPYFVAGAAVLAFPAAQGSGRLLLRFGPARMAPLLLTLSAVLFFCEWLLLAKPRAAAVLLFAHSSILGAIAISAFYSLLNERFDPHSAKALMARVAGAATLGGLLGGLGAERIAALFSTGTLLLVLAALGLLTVTGSLLAATGGTSQTSSLDDLPPTNAWTEIRSVPLLRNLALVTMLGAVLSSQFDYVLKAEAVAWLGRGEPLVRFFGFFYAATGFATFLIQTAFGRLAVARLGLAGSIAVHPVMVGIAGVIRLILPSPLTGILPRGLEMTLRNSVARTGYELLFTPLPPASKRAAKSLIDVTGDSIGKGIGSGLVLLATRLTPTYALFAVNLAGVVAAVAETLVARRLKLSYVAELEGGLRRQHGAELVGAAEQSLSDFTMVRSYAVLDRETLRRALGETTAAPSADPVGTAFLELRSGNLTRVRNTLDALPPDPVLIGALVPLLANRQLIRPVSAALSTFGPRAAGELVSALASEATAEVVRRRIPMLLRDCHSPVARDGLLSALDGPSLEVRARAAQALLSLTETFPELSVSGAAALDAAARELAREEDSPRARRHVFNLLALALEREPVQIAARAMEGTDDWARGTSLEYLETVLPPALYAALYKRLSSGPLLATPALPSSKPPAQIRADLLKAGETMTASLADIRSRLAAMEESEEDQDA